MSENNQNESAEVVSIMSRNSEVAYRFYKQRFYDAMEDYRRWRQEHQKIYASVVEWKSLLEGAEHRQKAEMWLSVCLRLKQYMHEKRQVRN